MKLKFNLSGNSLSVKVRMRAISESRVCVLKCLDANKKDCPQLAAECV